jgi:GH25 family lysozyme M1 (1,4-beta-N-acetylmuramidase)
VLAAVAVLLGAGGAAAPARAASGLPGIDVSHFQWSIDWAKVKGSGVQFAYIKATEGTTFHDSAFDANYSAAYHAGIIRGAYHFARPNSSGGAAQANYFVDHGGAWSADGKTLPGTLDAEWGPQGSTCYGLSTGAMRAWIGDFVNTYHARTTRWPVIYTPAAWWNQCTGSDGAVAANDPLWIVKIGSSPAPMPAGWGDQTIWQHGQGSVPGISGSVDLDTFNGSADRLTVLAKGS